MRLKRKTTDPSMSDSLVAGESKQRSLTVLAGRGAAPSISSRTSASNTVTRASLELGAAQAHCRASAHSVRHELPSASDDRALHRHAKRGLTVGVILPFAASLSVGCRRLPRGRHVFARLGPAPGRRRCSREQHRGVRRGFLCGDMKVRDDPLREKKRRDLGVENGSGRKLLLLVVCESLGRGFLEMSVAVSDGGDASNGSAVESTVVRPFDSGERRRRRDARPVGEGNARD